MRLALIPLLLAVSAPALAQPSGQGAGLPPFVVAEGTSSVSVAPDRAVIRFGVQHQDATAQKAQGAVNGAMQKILTALRRLDVPANRITTARIDLFPVYAQQRPNEYDQAPKLAGFRASNTVRVEIDLAGKGPEIGSVLDAAIGAGANSVEGISFELADDTQPRSKALRAAADNARAKAGAIADALGSRLGELREASEGGVEVGPIQPFMMKAEMHASSAPTQVEAGEIRVSATVRVRYAIEPKGTK